MIEADCSSAPFNVIEGAYERLRPPTSEICGNSWPRTTSMLSRAASSAKVAEITLKLLFAARLSASSRVAGSAGRSRGNTNLPGGWPTARTYSARLISSVPCGDEGALGLRQRRLGLRHVGAGDLADTEAVLGRFELLAQNLHVVAVDLDQCLVANDVEIGHRNRLEYRGLDCEGLRSSRLHGIDRLAGLRHGPAAPVNRLGYLESEAVRIKGRIGAAPARAG